MSVAPLQSQPRSQSEDADDILSRVHCRIEYNLHIWCDRQMFGHLNAVESFCRPLIIEVGRESGSFGLPQFNPTPSK